MAYSSLIKHSPTEETLVTKVLQINLVPRVSHLTAPWGERAGGGKMRDPGNEVGYKCLWLTPIQSVCGVTHFVGSSTLACANSSHSYWSDGLTSAFHISTHNNSVVTESFILGVAVRRLLYPFRLHNCYSSPFENYFANQSQAIQKRKFLSKLTTF